ncbi:hypothetical protein V6N11_057553 [Hibiscus sabdariffa]|uniref:Uncharacterized protein n=1 Tax=Hibiscus sabdariffa TaxID=183260 RepID=A0ABR1ZY41_9ROSI
MAASDFIIHGNTTWRLVLLLDNVPITYYACIGSDIQVIYIIVQKQGIKSFSHIDENNDRSFLCEINVDNSKAAMKDLQFALKASSIENADFLVIVPAAVVGSVLVEMAKCVEKMKEAVDELSERAHFSKTVEPTVSPEKPQQVLHRGIIRPVSGVSDDAHNETIVITIHEISTDWPENEKDDGCWVPSSAKSNYSYHAT